MMPPPPPKISFIVPIYNVASYLNECLDSILAQNIPKEIIIINDGSTDDSLNTAKRYLAEHPFIILINQHNRGVSAARNAGLRLAAGEYVYFVDGDDYLLETRLDAMAELADRHCADVCKGLLRHSYEDGRLPETRPPESPHITSPDQCTVSSGATHLHQMLARDWLPSVSFGFFRTEFLRENKLFFEENLSLSEDSLFMVQALSCRHDIRVLEVNRPFYNYRHRAESATTRPNYFQGFKDLFTVSEKLLAHRRRLQAVCADEQVQSDVLRVALINYGIAYRFQYLRFDAEHRALARPYFTPQIVELMEKFLPQPIVL